MKKKLLKLGVTLYEPIIGSLLSSMRSEVVHMAVGLGAKNIFDCCCGAGGLLNVLAQQGFVHCVGLDKNPYMLNKCGEVARRAQLVHGDACQLPFASKSFDISTVCMALHTMPLVTARQLMEELCRVSQYCIVADYCLAERNIALPAAILSHIIEALVGGEHYRCYKAFQGQGGLEGFLHSMALNPVMRRSTLGGAGLVVVIDNT